MKNILLFGKNGQIGWELQRTLAPLGRIVALESECCDLYIPEMITKTIRELKPNVIVNAAAYTAVDKAETDAVSAAAINTVAPGIMAEEAKRLRVPLIHYSTDYIFDGASKVPYVENDSPCPLNVYGRTKLEGERAIVAAGGSYLILRTSWVYGHRGRNFFLTMLKLAEAKRELRVVDDQIGAPSWSRLIAEATSLMIPQLKPDFAGLFHLSSQGETSWYGFARKIFDIIKAPSGLSLVPILSKEYPTPAKRPCRSLLSCNKLASVFGLQLPSWDEGLSLCIASDDFSVKNIL